MGEKAVADFWNMQRRIWPLRLRHCNPIDWTCWNIDLCQNNTGDCLVVGRVRSKRRRFSSNLCHSVRNFARERKCDKFVLHPWTNFPCPDRSKAAFSPFACPFHGFFHSRSSKCGLFWLTCSVTQAKCTFSLLTLFLLHFSPYSSSRKLLGKLLKKFHSWWTKKLSWNSKLFVIKTST